MTVMATEALTGEQMVKIAREQVDAFNSGDWERLEAGLAADASYNELATQRKVDGPEKIVELFKGWKTAFPDAAGTVTSARSQSLAMNCTCAGYLLGSPSRSTVI